MKVISTIFIAAVFIAIGFLFLPSGNEGKNIRQHSGKRTQGGEYDSQYKRRDFIRERHEEKLREINVPENIEQVSPSRHHEDFMVYNRLDESRSNYDDFR